MPTYEYRCGACGHDFETFQKFSEAALTVCPQCGGELHKVFNPVGIVFKGSGFYSTDNGSRKSFMEAGVSPAVQSAGDASTGTETKTGVATMTSPAAAKTATGKHGKGKSGAGKHAHPVAE